MSINLDDSHEINEEGLAITTNSDGSPIFYLCSGEGVPTGISAPVNTMYLDKLTRQIWQKYDTGDNDWIIGVGTFPELTLSTEYRIPETFFATLNNPCIESSLIVEGTLEIV